VHRYKGIEGVLTAAVQLRNNEIVHKWHSANVLNKMAHRRLLDQAAPEVSPPTHVRSVSARVR
jgi:hypothetical protein